MGAGAGLGLGSVGLVAGWWSGPEEVAGAAGGAHSA